MTLNIRKFDEEAPAWDENPHRHQLAADIFKTLQEVVPFSETMNVLDFGCGTGLVTLKIAGKVGKITGADSSGGMLEMLRGKVAQSKITNVDTLQLGPEEGITTGERYNLIVSSMTFHHVEDIERLLRDFYELLLPGGQLALVDLDSEGGRFHTDKTGVFHQGFDRNALKRKLEEAGFCNVADCTAGQVTRPAADTGLLSTFTVFLITACR